MNPQMLPLSTKVPATGEIIDRGTQNQQAVEMNNEQILKQHYDTLDTREKSRLQSVVVGAAQLKQFLDNNDLEGAHNFLTRRRTGLQGRLANGEQIDTEDTDAALQMLRSGNIEELQNNVNALMAAGRVVGISDSPDMPSNIQEWQEFNRMTPEDQQRYLQMKRANQVVNQGNQQTIIDPSGRDVRVLPVNPKLEDTPDYQRQVEAAKMEGRGETPENVKTERGKTMVTNLVNKVVPNLEGLAAEGGSISTQSGAASNVWASIKGSDIGQFAQNITGTEEQSLRNRIKNQKPALMNAIRQATGLSASQMNSNIELQFYMQQIGDDKVDIESQLFALKQIDDLYGKGMAAVPETPGAPTAGGTQQSATVILRDPQTNKRYEIPAEFADQALSEGLVRE